MDTNTQTGSESQGQSQDTGLNTAMDNWQAGETEPGTGQQQTQETTQQTAPAQQTGTTQTAPTQQIQQTAAPVVDTKSLIEAAVNSTAAAMQKVHQANTPAQQERPMTDAEFRARYGLPYVDAKAIERLFDKDPNLAAKFLNDLLLQNTQASLKMAQDLYKADLDTRMQAFQPKMTEVERFIAEQKEVAATTRFYKSNPDLQAESDLVKEVLDATQAKISRGELKFDNEAQAFKYVADATKKVLSRMTPAQGTTSTGGQQSPRQGQRQMAAASMGGRPGGQAAKPASDIDTVMAAWDQQ